MKQKTSTKGTLKNKPKESEKQSTIVPELPMKNGIMTLENNAKTSRAVAACGVRLAEQIDREGMNDETERMAADYIASCGAEVKRLMAVRKPFTALLTDIQKRFVQLEKAIDPAVAGSPAYALSERLKAFRKRRMAEAEEKERRLLKNREATARRVMNRTELSETEREEALRRADERLLKGQAAIALERVETVTVPVVKAPEGYIDLWRFWWQEVGQHLDDADLQRIFHPALAYAKKQARRGVRIESEHVKYVEEPKLRA